MKKLNVLSLFDGVSCGRIALERAGINVGTYFASEIDAHAIKVSKDNWANIIHVGDVKKVSYRDGMLYTENGVYQVEIDLLIGGSPCQDFSGLRALGQHGAGVTGLAGDKSSLFYEYLRIKSECKPTYWLLENVKMKNSSKLQLDEFLGIEGKLIDSSLVSFQKRARYYWSNLPLTTPDNLYISFQDHKSVGDLSKYKLNATPSRMRMWNDGKGNNNVPHCANVTYSEKIYCLTTKQDRCPNSGLVAYEDFCRTLTHEELEKAQTVPVGYTQCLTYYQAQTVLGNGWTVDVIAHIFKGLRVAEEIACN